MPSPFPGMNPYLEQEEMWEDFHNAMIIAVREALTPRLDERYFAKVEQRVYIHELSAEERRYIGKADVGVADVGATAAGGIGLRPLNAPASMLLPQSVEHFKNLYIEIRTARGHDLVTVIEILSPSNKRPGGDRDQYLGKRDELLHSPANFVEFDLLRGGARAPADQAPAGDYFVTVSRPAERPRAAVWPVNLRDRLPVTQIPLREGDVNIPVDLQALVHDVYDAAGYRRVIYQGTPQPPLGEADAEWARQFLPGR